ncbi:MAG: antitoxin Xre/MbcA/ParS toxin-binding domain-containing protein [Acidobacteriota bacterium]
MKNAAASQERSRDRLSRTPLLRLVEKPPAQVHREVLDGLDYQDLVSFQETTGLPQKDLFRVIDLPSATATRRKRAGRLHPRESDRLSRVARIVGRSEELFGGDLEKAVVWLQRPQRALAGETPLSFLATDAGANEVEDLIGRLIDGSVA